ncbi:hypothetical protein BD289DRAFT_176256 [Coniella lustricola]|uniref:Transmembrane protein n=1 Tax=Coniella lustricola TaxID=2025994 RepID=A0A2T2ZTQ6_9PEZI|nr:hypothetical protein BD289DRAFT_176256 [Coniella lustricola]
MLLGRQHKANVPQESEISTQRAESTTSQRPGFFLSCLVSMLRFSDSRFINPMFSTLSHLRQRLKSPCGQSIPTSHCSHWLTPFTRNTSLGRVPLVAIDEQGGGCGSRLLHPMLPFCFGTLDRQRLVDPAVPCQPANPCPYGKSRTSHAFFAMHKLLFFSVVFFVCVFRWHAILCSQLTFRRSDAMFERLKQTLAIPISTKPSCRSIVLH